ncbi:O-antigen ligase family protein [Candidatus Uhrbacteria bacterium]|nr:O-antigen ligase family protein [Candidatus Uhrbacteria bacterium]
MAAALASYAWSLHFLPETNRFYEGRIAGVFNNPSYLAAFMLFAAGVTSLLWAQLTARSGKSSTSGERSRTTGWWRHVLFGGLLLFFTVTLVFTGTRGSYLGLVVGLALFSLLAIILLRKTNRGLVFAVGGLLLATLLAISSIFVFKESNLVKDNDILSRIAVVSTLTNIGSARERYVNWQVAIESFRAKPVLGWGPENYDAAFNAHYNYLAGKDEPWFDSSHNQLLDVLTEGGLVGFSLYLFWIAAIFYAAARLLRKGTRDKLTGSILAGTYLGFLVQGWFLFDTFPMYLGLFPMLGFAYFRYERARGESRQTEQTGSKAIYRNIDRGALRAPMPATWVYGLALVLILITPYLIYKNVWQPYRANALIFQYQSYLNGGGFREAAVFLREASKIDSPYVNFDVGNQSAWNLLYVLDNPLPEQSRNDAHEVFKLLAEREEKSLGYRPLDHQVYYVLGRLYRYGYQDFGIPEYLTKSETYLKQGRAISPKRVEYVSELADTLLLQGKREEAENLVKEHAASIGPPYSYKFVGNLYFVLENYDLALAEFKKAEAAGLTFWENETEYSRYVFAGQQTGDFEAVLRLSEQYIAKRGPDAVAFFNQAVAYYYLGNGEEARKAYLKVLALDRSYEQYSAFFISQ